MRKSLLPIFILLFLVSCVDAKGCPKKVKIFDADDVAYRRQIQRLREDSPGVVLSTPQEYQVWKEKMLIKGSWRWDIDEWEILIHGTLPSQPAYYFDEEMHVSNGGYSIA